MIVGAQGYTLRNFMQSERDIRRSLKKVAEIGYTTVQISAIGPIDPAVLRGICDENGLSIVLTHTAEAKLLGDIDGVIRDHKIMGCPYIGLGSMPERYRSNDEWVRYFAEDFLPIAQKIRDAGMLFMYHNHNFEFEKKNGRMLMDDLLELFPADLMGVTLDTYWLQAAGCDIIQWIEKLKDRIPCVHLKDMAVKGYEIRMAAVGEGNLNFPAILDTLKRLNRTKYILVEQDNCYEQHPYDCLAASYRNLNQMGYR